MGKQNKSSSKPAPALAGSGKKSKSNTPEPAIPTDKLTRSKGRAAVANTLSWTGKLPGSLLHEHCQKQKWEKVIYDMVKTRDGFVGVLHLSWKNPKTQEIIEVKMMPERSIVQPQETSLEARHYCATYALHRIAFDKNIHMVLPTNHKHLWSDLERFRKELTVKNPAKALELYNPDPFNYILEKRKLDLRKANQIEAQKTQELKVKKLPTLLTTKTLNNNTKPALSKVTKPQKPAHLLRTTTTFPRKIWDSAPFIDLKPESRDLISKSIKSHISWTTHESNKQDDSASYQLFMVSLGFRAVHVEEALKYTNSFTETLEWLIFHLPEDDLPPMFAKSLKDSNISLKVTGNLKKEYIIRRLTNAGFDSGDITAALLKYDMDEIEAGISLTYDLINYSEPAGDGIEISKEESENIWNDEMESLSAIYEGRFKKTDEFTCEIKLNPHNMDSGALTLRILKPRNYPHALPGLHLLVSDPSYQLANYIRISIVRQLLKFVIESGLIGDSFIFSCVDWLENEIPNIVENPGPLFTEGEKILQEASGTKAAARKSRNQNRDFRTKKLSLEDIDQLSKAYQKLAVSPQMKKSLSGRASLPAWKKQQDIIKIIDQNKVTLITGETGSGKSTQAVQFILDDLIRKNDFQSSIICTQPRRISAIGLAERVAEERCTTCGQEVGYIIRGENKTNANTRISFVTTGVLLRMVQGLLSKSGADSYFKSIGYIFIDEVHERSIDSDFLLIILKKIILKYPKLKIVLMSATTDVNVFRDYFPQGLGHIHIEGRTFPIEDHYLDEILQVTDFTIQNNSRSRGRSRFDDDDEDGIANEVDDSLKPKANSKFFQDGNINYELIASLTNYVHEKLNTESNNGSLLIFLPGVLEINSCIRAISKSFRGKCLLLPLHSALSSNDQKKVFQIPAKGVRKIVVSTNVAETSITIPDAVCVIDSGRAKSNYYDPRLNTTKLIEKWCSQAEVGQRRGRAGRITNGLCYKLYTRKTHEEMLKQPIPEIKRVRLENVYLVVKSIGITDVEAFLASGLDPPDSSTIEKSHQFLKEIGALGDDDNLTHLGSYLSLLPTDLQSGKLLILGAIFGCVETALTLASISSIGTPFINNFENRDAIKLVQQKFSQGQGDLIAIVNAYNEYENLRSLGSGGSSRFLSDNYLSFLKLKEMRSTRSQYISILQDLGFIPLDYGKKPYQHLNRNNFNWNIVRSVITGAYYPQITRVQLPDPRYLATLSGAVAVDPDDKETKLWIKNDKYFNSSKIPQGEFPSSRLFLHPSSSLFIGNDNELLEDGTKAQSLKSSFAVYNSSVHTSKFFIRDVTPSSTLSVLLFGGDMSYDLSGIQDISHPSPGIVLDNWSPIRTWCKNAVLIKQLRILLDNVIADKFSSPSYDDEITTGSSVLEVVERVLETDAVK